MLTHSAIALFDYDIAEQLYSGSRTLVYRAVRKADQQPVVIKLLSNEHPSFSELVGFRNQYTIAKNLNSPGIIQSYGLEPYRNGYAMVMEDFGGISLGQFALGKPLCLDVFYPIALQIADILHHLYRNRIIHKDIKLANILINPDTQQVKLIDFSIASLLPRETPEIQNPNILEGTLAYLSPEQTGRMNRGIDYRSDFYSLGVSFYQLLTGQLPFQSQDPMELVHSHLAKQPTAIHSLNPAIPPMLSEIVAKLMAKNAEDRYQSALGLKHDLELCLTQYQEKGNHVRFTLGERDICDRFLIPERLYGRESAVIELLSAFNHVSEGKTELLLVAGFSGIGKTAVVNEVHKPIVRQRGYFIKGKFDQFNRNIPLSAFVQAGGDLMGQLLSESDTELAQWQAQISSAVGDNGQVLIEVIPELEQVIGQQPTVPELSGSAAQNRFNLLFQKFIEVFTTKKHPLVMFLDDLQWADSASLELIKILMNGNSYLLMLGAYRDNEVSSAHPFILTVAELRKNKAIVNTITLAPLAFTDTNHLVADTLNCSPELAQPLTELIDRKTHGNPFFTTQFLKALYEEKYITFNGDHRYWECDIAQVNALAITDDVVEFMALQLQKLPIATQDVLKLAACIGNQFDLTTLAIVLEQSPTDAATALWKALQEGLILPASQVYKFFQGTEKSTIENPVNPKYRFLHDRVQQAAYSLIPEDQQQSTHLAIARLLRQNTPDAELEANIFEIVNHWNSAIALLLDPIEKTNLAQLNLIAGNKAKAANAYEPALIYCRTGLALLEDLGGWQNQVSLMLVLHEGAAEAAYLCGDFVQMDQWVSAILAQKLEPLHLVKTYEIQIQAHSTQSQFSEAIAIGQNALTQFNIHLPNQPAPADIVPAMQDVAALLNGRTADGLLELPVMTDAEALASMQLLSSIFAASYISAPLLFPFVILAQVNISIQYGNTALSAFSYSCYAILLSSVLEDLDAAYEFGQLALKLAENFEVPTVQAKVNVIVGNIIQCKSHCQNSLPLFTEAFKIGQEVGDFEYTGYSAANLCVFSYAVGKELTTLLAEIEIHIATLLKLNIVAGSNYCSTIFQTIQRLQATRNEAVLTAQKDLYHTLTIANDLIGLSWYWVYRLTASYLLNEMVEAKQDAAAARQAFAAVAGQISTPIFYFYDSLTALADFSEMTDKTAVLDRVFANQTKLHHHAYHAPMNFQHKYDLVEAERSRVLGNKIEAIELYDQAIFGAKENGFIQEEALANELAAKFYLDWGKEKVAAGYMQEAYYCYTKWGAKAKIVNLETLYPQLLQPILQQPKSNFNALETLTNFTNSTTKNSSTSISDSLDFASVIQVAQSLSSAIKLDDLLRQLTQIILQSSGGNKCILVLPQNETWQVRAISTLETTELCSIPLDDNPDVPIKLIQYVKRTQSVVVIDNLQTDLPVIDDYLIQRNPKSVLCLPILNQGHLAGILYLRNEMTAGVFTSDRLTVINFLCIQAAISLENAQLYQNLQRSEANEHEKATELAQMLTILQLRNKKLAFRADVDAGLTTHENLSDMLQSTTEAMVQHLDAAFARIWTLNSAENVLELQASAGQYIHLDGPHARVPVGKFKIGLIAEECHPHLTNDVLNDPRVGDKEWAKREGMIAFAGYPLIVENQIMGVMAMFARHTLDDEILEVLSSVADEIASAIKRKYIQKALQESEIELRQKSQQIEQAFQQLQQTQLQMVQSEKMSALGNLVAGVAHEINNPIGFLGGNIKPALDYINDLFGLIDLVQKKYPQLDPEIQEEMETIDLEYIREDFPNLIASMKEGVSRIRDISTSLRTFSRADTDRPVACNIHDGINSTIMILKHRLKANENRPEIEVIKDYGNLAKIECYAGQLNQVFMNILGNAIDALDESNHGRSFAEIQAKPNCITITTSVENNRVKIAIADNGKGMNEEVKAKVFDHLFTTKEVGKGTGLGLAIAYQIVTEKHGGAISVNSAPGNGTEFAIALPIFIEDTAVPIGVNLR
ncbi:MAG: AAA family ATPase [Microcoleus sp.]